jgi:hypothetical protein
MTDYTKNELTVWSDGLYIALYLCKYILGFFFYIITINTSYELGKSKYYKIDPTFGFKL